jgi:large subunit ribosomal protein L7/L12
MFSQDATEQSAESVKQEFDNITDEEKTKYRYVNSCIFCYILNNLIPNEYGFIVVKYSDSWGLKFDDECIKFEKEWEQIAKDKTDAQRIALTDEMTDNQRKKVEFIVDKILSLNPFEMRYMAMNMQDRVQKISGLSPMKLNMDWPSVKKDVDGTWPPLNPNWFKQQELQAQLGPFMGGFSGQGGGQGGAAQGGAGEVEEEEKEVKAEKTSFDVELTSYDAKSKIKLIKEIRGLLGLGLKEAKELVESAPIWIKKDMKLEDAEALMAKIETFGAQLKMV